MELLSATCFCAGLWRDQRQIAFVYDLLQDDNLVSFLPCQTHPTNWIFMLKHDTSGHWTSVVEYLEIPYLIAVINTDELKTNLHQRRTDLFWRHCHWHIMGNLNTVLLNMIIEGKILKRTAKCTCLTFDLQKVYSPGPYHGGYTDQISWQSVKRFLRSRELNIFSSFGEQTT